MYCFWISCFFGILREVKNHVYVERRIKMKKIVSILLTFSLAISSIAFIMPQTVFAANENENVEYQKELISTDVDYFIDEETGLKYQIVFEEYIDVPKTGAANINNAAETRSLFPEYTLGERRYYTIKVQNDDLADVGELGQTLSDRGKQELARKIANQLVAKVGSKFLPGINAASIAIEVAAKLNNAVGNNGFKADITLIYSSTYINGGGYYLYGWGIEDISVGLY